MTSQENINTEIKSQPQLIFENAYQEVMDLQIVEGFFSAVERKFLQFSHTPFEVKRAKDSLATLKELANNGAEIDFYKSNQLLVELLNGWKKQLIERDASIETQQIRRFCDEFKKPFDPKVFTALTRFYRSLPHSLSSQSKYDFTVTRLFLKPTNQNFREIKFERDEIISQLIKFARDWDISPNFSPNTDENVIEIITKFDEFIFEAEFITSFEELVKSRLFENLRDFKSQIGEIFYHPSVTVSAIECNVFVGNIFAELLAQENEKLSRIISNEFDFATVLHDTSPNAFANSNQILAHIRTDSLTQAINPDEDATHIWEWLQTVCAKTIEKPTIDETVKSTEILLPAKGRISEVLEIINNPTSNKTLLFDYLQKSTALKNLDFGIFLSSETPETQKGIFRATLATVIWSDEIRTHELMKNDKLTDVTSHEISLILEESQTLYEQLKTKVDEMGAEVSHNLLYVSNQLLEARLKLERAIVRYSKHNLETTIVPEEKPKEIPVPKKKSYSTSAFTVNPWVLAVTILTLLISFGIYFSVNFMDNGVNVSKDVEIIEVTKLPGTENFQTAQRVKNMLHITAKESWKNLNEESQRNLLKQLLSFPTKTQLKSIIILDSEGKEVATASADLIETTAQLDTQAK